MLSELLKRIMRQEGRHIDFYATHAIDALDGSPRAQKLVRFTLKRVWRPVGASVMPGRRGRSHDPLPLRRPRRSRGRGSAVDRQVDRLPGQSGLHLLGRTVAAA